MPDAATSGNAERLWLHQAVIAVVASVVMFTNLGGSRLWDRDEPRNAGCGREMLDRGDWVVPYFNAELRAHKPVLLYWLIMSAYAVFGVNEFAARFWSAALAVGSALMTYHIGRRLFAAWVGLWSGIILATSLMFDVAGHWATPDSALIFFSTLAVLIYVLATDFGTGSYFPRRRPAVAAMYAAMGVAVLAKGPVGFVLPTAVIGMFLLIMWLPETQPLAATEVGRALLPVANNMTGRSARPRRWQARLLGLLRPFAPRHFLQTCWRMRPLTAVAIIGAVALPWYVWVGVRTEGKFLSEFFYEHNLGRAAQPMEGHDGPLLLFYPVGILVGFFPWSVFAIPTVIGVAAAIRRRGPWHPGCVLAVCWIVVYVGVFSLAQTKLLNYVTPCYPALAMLTACFLVEWMRGRAPMRSLWPKLSLVTLGTVGLGMLIIVPFVTHRLLPGEAWLAALGLIPLLGAAAGIVFVRRGQVQRAVFAAASAAVVFVTAGFGWAMPRVDRHQQNHLLLAAIERTGGSSRIGAYGRLEPTWIFYGGRAIVELGERPRPDPATFFGDGKDTYIITTDRHWDHLRPTLPHEASVLADYPLFLRRERLLLVGLPQPTLTAARSVNSKR